MLMFLLAFGAASQVQETPAEEIQSYLRQLDDDSADLREEARRRIVALGPRALPELKNSHLVSKGALKLVLSGLISEIEGLERSEWLRPPKENPSFDFSGIRLDQALSAVARRYGLSEIQYDPELAALPISLTMADVDLWEASARLAKAVDAEVGLTKNRDLRISRTPQSGNARSVVKNQAWFFISTRGVEERKRGPELVLEIDAYLHPRRWVEGVDSMEVQVQSASGKAVPSRCDPVAQPCERIFGRPSRFRVATVSVPFDQVKNAGSLTVSAKLAYKVPVDICPIPLSRGDGVTRAGIQGATVSVACEQGATRWEIYGDTTLQDLDCCVSVLDAQGHVLFDLGPFRSEKGCVFNRQGSVDGLPSPPSNLRIWKVQRSTVLRSDFTISGVSVRGG